MDKGAAAERKGWLRYGVGAEKSRATAMKPGSVVELCGSSTRLSVWAAKYARHYEAVGNLCAGERAFLLETSGDRWAKIVLANGAAGYVDSAFLQQAARDAE